MVPRELFNAIEGYTEESINEWRRTRWQTWVNVQGMTDKIKSPADLLPLQGDPAPVPKKTMSKEARKRLESFWDANPPQN